VPHRKITEAEENQMVVERVFAAISEGRHDDIRELLDPDLSWHPLPRSGVGHFTGREEALAWLKHFGPGQGGIEVKIEKIQTIWGWIIVLGTLKDRRNGDSQPFRAGWRVRVRDGRLVEGFASEGWEDAIAAAQD
jgi:limonene-1,2-epoxide hydrolase